MSQGLSGREEGTPASVGGATNRATGPAVDRRVSFVRQESRSKFYFFVIFPILIFGNGELGAWGFSSHSTCSNLISVAVVNL